MGEEVASNISSEPHPVQETPNTSLFLVSTHSGNKFRHVSKVLGDLHSCSALVSYVCAHSQEVGHVNRHVAKLQSVQVFKDILTGFLILFYQVRA